MTDLKAAIRYLRYNAGNLAGDTERIFSFGMSGGGAQSALLGVTGDSSLYDDYLAAPGGDGAEAGSIGALTDFTAIDQIRRKENSAGLKISGTFATAQDYIDALNADGTWVNYDAATGTATITSIADFAAAVKTASKGIAAFDQLDASQGENTLFGYGDGAGVHFDATLAEILETIGSSYATDYSDDMSRVDALGHSVADRVKMYSPLYYLLASSEGYQSANVANTSASTPASGRATPP